MPKNKRIAMRSSWSSAWAAWIFILLQAGASAQIEIPRIGWILDGSGGMHPVRGLAASASVGSAIGLAPPNSAVPRRTFGGLRNLNRLDPPAPGEVAPHILLGQAASPAIGYACAASLCLIKQAAAIVSMDAGSGAVLASIAAPAGPALFAMDGTGAYVYFPDTGQLAQWSAAANTAAANTGANTARAAAGVNTTGAEPQLDFALPAFAPNGEVLSMRAQNSGVDYAVRSDDGIWIEHYSPGDGSITSLGSLSSSTLGPVMLLADGVVFADPNNGSVSIHRTDGSSVSVPLPGVRQLFAAGDGYIQVTGGSGGTWVLRTDTGNEQLMLLPPTAAAGAVAGAPANKVTHAGTNAIRSGAVAP